MAESALQAGPGRMPAHLLRSLSLRDWRGYAALDLELGDGAQLVWGPNAAGKTSLLEAIVVLALGRSHRTSTDAELIRWGRDLARVEGHVQASGTSGGARPAAPVEDVVDVALGRPGAAAGTPRKRIRLNGVPRRAGALAGVLRVVIFAPEDMLLVVGSPALRRASLDQLAAQRAPAYAHDLATYGRALQQRNSLLRAIREGEATRDELAFWDRAFIEAGGAVVAERLRLLDALTGPLARAHAEIAPDEGALTAGYGTNSPLRPGESPRDALARRLAETADREQWNGTTLIGPHRDDLVFALDGRELATFASRGQQRTAILALKLAEMDLLTGLDGRPPLLLLDDVFSELDPERRAHLVRRIAALPQSFVTTTTPDDLEPELRDHARHWEAVPAGVLGEGAAIR